MSKCPACVDEAYVARKFPMLDFAGCRPGKVRTAPVDRLCAHHQQERRRIDSSEEDAAVGALKTLVGGLRERPNLRAVAEQLNGSRERLNEAIRDVEDALYARRLPPRMVRLDRETTLAWDGEQFTVIRRHERGTPLIQSSLELRLHAMSADVLGELRRMLAAGKERP